MAFTSFLSTTTMPLGLASLTLHTPYIEESNVGEGEREFETWLRAHKHAPITVVWEDKFLWIRERNVYFWDRIANEKVVEEVFFEFL